jgi:hypothetical protein
MTYTKSLVCSNLKTCRICGASNAEVHHVFFGPFRKSSEKYGMKVALCPTHHRGLKTGVHGGNTAIDLRLKKEAQEAFERVYGHDKFMDVFCRNYLN